MTPSGLGDKPLLLCTVLTTGGALLLRPTVNFKLDQIEDKHWKPDIYTQGFHSCDRLASAFTLTDWLKTGSRFPRPPERNNQWPTQPVGTPLFLNFKCQGRYVDSFLLSLKQESRQKESKGRERGKYLKSEFGSFSKTALKPAGVVTGAILAVFPEESHGSRSGSAEPAHHCWGNAGGPHLGLCCICAALAFCACKGVLLVRSQTTNQELLIIAYLCEINYPLIHFKWNQLIWFDWRWSYRCHHCSSDQTRMLVAPSGTGGGLWACRFASQTVAATASVMPPEENQGWDLLFWCFTASLLTKTPGSPWSRSGFLLGTVKEPDLSACGIENFSLKWVFRVTSVPSTMFPSTYQSICTSCVWTCPATRGRHAPAPMTTPSTGRSDGFVRYSDIQSIMCGFICQAPVCSPENPIFVLWSLWRTSTWTGNLFTWWEPPWVGTWLESMLPAMLQTSVAWLWSVQTVSAVRVCVCVRYN